MSSGRYIIALDQGTTSSRAVLFDQQGHIKDIVQQEFTQNYPKPGWVEHDPEEIWNTQSEVLFQVIKKNDIEAVDIAALGITNQRETTIIWDKRSGKPVYNAIVWQDTRTTDICEGLKAKGLEEYVKEHTGLVIDSYFSATKIKWILDNVSGAREKAENGELLFGTVDTWLIWKLTGGDSHVTDYSNASRTMLYDIHALDWDASLLKELGIPAKMLPQVKPSSYHFGDFNFDGVNIPIGGVLGDQQAALFGQACFEPGMAKNTYGTGCFMLMNIGKEITLSKSGLVTSVGWGLDGEVCYALEGSIFIAGAAIQWLRDGLKIIASAAETTEMAEQVRNDNDVFVVPAFAGLGAPYWDMYARGAIFGLTRDTGRAQIAKATLESLAYQTRDVIHAMENDSGLTLQTLKVDGGATVNNYLMQFQADILGVNVERPEVIESTAQGSAYMAGIYTGIWCKEDIIHNRKVDRLFKPNLDVEKRDALYRRWQSAVKRTMGWLKE